MVVIAISPSASRRRFPASGFARRLGNPFREFAAARRQVGDAADVLGRTAQQRWREQDFCRVADLLRRGFGGDLPEPGQLGVGGDDVPEVIGGSFAARTCIASARAATVIPTMASDSGTVRGASIRSAPGRSPAASNSIRRAPGGGEGILMDTSPFYAGRDSPGMVRGGCSNHPGSGR